MKRAAIITAKIIALALALIAISILVGALTYALHAGEPR